MRRAAKRTTSNFNWDNFDSEDKEQAPTNTPAPAPVETPPPPAEPPAPSAPPPKPLTQRQIAVEYQLWLQKNLRFVSDADRQTAFRAHLDKKQAAAAAAAAKTSSSAPARDERTHLSSYSSDSQRGPAKQWTNIAAFHEQKAISSDQLLAEPAAPSISPGELLNLAQTKVVSFLDFLTRDDNAIPISQRNPPAES